MAPSWPHSEPPPTSFDWHHINWAWISHISCGSLYHILQTNINFSQDIYLLNFQKKINLIKILLIFKSITNLTFKWIFKNHYHIVQALKLSLSLKFNEWLWRFHLKRNPLIIASLWLKDTVLRFCRTFTLESLSEQTVQQSATVITEGRRHVVIDLEPVRNVNIESLRHHLKH